MSLSPVAQSFWNAISKRDTLYASKPKKATGDQQYVWRMVAFCISPYGPNACMPMTADFNVQVPTNYLIVAPLDYVAAQKAKLTDQDREYIAREKDRLGFTSDDQYFQHTWERGARRRHYIKNVLEPLVDEIIAVKYPKPKDRAGLVRWGNALGIL